MTPFYKIYNTIINTKINYLFDFFLIKHIITPTKERLLMKPVYAIIGDDEASKEVRLLALKKAFAESVGSNNIEIYDANSTNPSYILMNLTTVSLFTGGRLVIIRNFDAWGEGVKKTPTPSDEDLKDFIEYTENPSSDTILVFVGIRFPKKLVIWKEFFKAVEKNGKILEYNLPKDWEMEQWIIDKAKEIDLVLNKIKANNLLTLVGKDSMALYNEMVKLKTYKPTSEITNEDISYLIMNRPKAAEFKLMEALSNRDYHSAIKILNESIEARVPIHKMVYPLMKELRMLLLIKEAVKNHASDEKIQDLLIENDFYKMKTTPWVIKQLKKRADNYEIEQLIKSIWTVSTLDYELKGGLRIKRPFQLSYELTFYDIINNSKDNDLYI